MNGELKLFTGLSVGKDVQSVRKIVENNKRKVGE